MRWSCHFSISLCVFFSMVLGSVCGHDKRGVPWLRVWRFGLSRLCSLVKLVCMCVCGSAFFSQKSYFTFPHLVTSFPSVNTPFKASQCTNLLLYYGRPLTVARLDPWNRLETIIAWRCSSGKYIEGFVLETSYVQQGFKDRGTSERPSNSRQSRAHLGNLNLQLVVVFILYST